MRLPLLVCALIATAAPAFAGTSACRLVRIGDVAKAVGPVLLVKGEHIDVCAGMCDGTDRSLCHFAVDSATHTTIDVGLSLPPYDMPEDRWRVAVKTVMRADHSVPVRAIEGLGEAALWSFTNGRGALAVFAADKYHLSIVVEGIAGEDAARAACETLARAAIARMS